MAKVTAVELNEAIARLRESKPTIPISDAVNQGRSLSDGNEWMLVQIPEWHWAPTRDYFAWNAAGPLLKEMRGDRMAVAASLRPMLGVFNDDHPVMVLAQVLENLSPLTIALAYAKWKGLDVELIEEGATSEE